MRIFEAKVSEREYIASPMPNREDILMLAYCLGATLAMELPPLRCLKITQQTTQNPRLRFILDQVIGLVAKGNRSSFFDAFSNHPDLLSDEFLECLREEEDDFMYNTGIPKVACSLLQFAQQGGNQPAMMVAKMVDRPAATMEITKLIHQHCVLGMEFSTVLQYVEKRCSPKAAALVRQLRAKRIGGWSVANCFFSLMENHFDPLYMNIVDAAETDDKLILAFKLLTTS